jgi:putative phosphoesterase
VGPALARYLPPQLPVARVAFAAGLVSDTHVPDRCARLPVALGDVLSGVDLILHAGDVGELRVLDELSAIAPVVAVHGNDDTAAAQRELPYQQVIAVAGERILLCHTHHPDRAQELAERRDDVWGPKLDRRAAMGRRAGAGVVVWGHAHVPLACRHDGVLLINPGAIASGNYVTRQAVRTVAFLFLRDDGEAIPVHVDLASPAVPFAPGVDLAAGFRAAAAQVSASILAPDLAAAWPALRSRLGEPVPEAFLTFFRRLAMPCWEGERPPLTSAELREALRGAALPAALASLADELV